MRKHKNRALALCMSATLAMSVFMTACGGQKEDVIPTEGTNVEVTPTTGASDVTTDGTTDVTTETLTGNVDYSKLLLADGRIEVGNIADYVTLPDYSGFYIPAAEVAVTEEELLNAIVAIMSDDMTVNETEGTVAENGDTVVISYVGSVDGVEFEGGSTGDSTTELKLGSKTYIDDFEDQLVGHKVGETVNVNVTFPDPYKNNPDLAGKEALFVVEIKGVYEMPELTDELVAEKYSAYGNTVEELRKHFSDSIYDTNVKEYIYNYMYDNSVFGEMPEDYKAKSIDVLKEQYYYYYESINAYYSSFGYGFADFEEFLNNYFGVSLETFETIMETEAIGEMQYEFLMQALYENEGLTLTKDEIVEYLGNEGMEYDSVVEFYGEEYAAHSVIPYFTMAHLVEKFEVR